MPRRRRVRPEDAARALDRLAVVAGVAPLRGGWVPPPEPADADEPAERKGMAADPASCSAAPGQPAALEPAAIAAHPPGPVDVPGPRAAVYDPGRRGVVALVVVAVVAALVAGAVVLRGRPSEVAAPVVERPGVPIGASPPATGEVVVSVAGKVRRPGIVRLPAGSRVDDAVRAAGGATAPVGLLNLARRVVDGEQVLVGVAGPAVAGAPAGSGAGGLVDLNAAGAGELDDLPGIGPVLAERIVEWRTEHGRFASVDQLREVPGIGESKYAQLKSKVAV